MKNTTRHGELTERHWTIRFELNEDLENFDAVGIAYPAMRRAPLASATAF